MNLDLAPWTGAPDVIAGPGTDLVVAASATHLAGDAWGTTLAAKRFPPPKNGLSR